MSNLLETFLKSYPSNMTQQDIIARMNRLCGTSIQSGNISRWRSGKKGLSTKLANYMMKELVRNKVINRSIYLKLRIPEEL